MTDKEKICKACMLTHELGTDLDANLKKEVNPPNTP